MGTNARIVICRLAFVLCALVPTAVVSAWAVQRSRPVYRNAHLVEWRETLSQRLNGRAVIERVNYPSYWVARLDGLEFFAAEAKAPLVRCRTLEATRTKAGWVVEASQPELDVAQLAAAWKLLDDRLLRTATDDPVPCDIDIGELTLRSGDQAQTLTHVRVEYRPTATSNELIFQFRIAGIDAPHPCRLVFRRDRTASPPTTTWDFSTGGLALPCAAVSRWLTPLRSLGSECRFAGTFTGSANEETWQGEVNGDFLQIDLQTLVTENSAHRLTGVADAALALRMERGRIADVRGRVDARGGYISESLIAAVREHWRLGVDSNDLPPAQDGLLPYRRFAAEFQLTPTAFTLRGIGDPTRPGVVLTTATRPLLLDPTSQPLSPLAVARALVPRQELSLPASRESLVLLHWFPVPSASSDAEREPKVRVRFSTGPRE